MKWIRSVMLFAAGIAVGAVLTQSTAAQQNRSTGHRINHVGISVTNFDESLKFYTQVMGFKEAYRFPSQNGQPSTTFLQVNRDTFIEMAPANDRPAGLTHIGLYSDDAQASVTQFRQGGAMVGDVRPTAREFVGMLVNATGRPIAYHPQSVDWLYAAELFKWGIKRATGKSVDVPSRRDLVSRGLAAQPSPRWPTMQVAVIATCTSPSTTLHTSMHSSVVMMRLPVAVPAW